MTLWERAVYHEPVRVAAAIRAVVYAFLYVLKVDLATLGVVMGAVESVLYVVTRQSVTPNAKVETRTDGQPTTGIGAGVSQSGAVQ